MPLAIQHCIMLWWDTDIALPDRSEIVTHHVSRERTLLIQTSFHKFHMSCVLHVEARQQRQELRKKRLDVSFSQAPRVYRRKRSSNDDTQHLSRVTVFSKIPMVEYCRVEPARSFQPYVAGTERASQVSRTAMAHRAETPGRLCAGSAPTSPATTAARVA